MGRRYARGLSLVLSLLVLGGGCSGAGAQVVAAGRQRVVVPPLYGPLGVTPGAVKQGQLGSCYFHAVIAAIANHNARLIEGSIRDVGRGDYTVRLADGTNETVRLADVLFARENRFDLSDGLWVTVLLRGLAQNTLRKALLSAIAATALPAAAKGSAVQLVSGSDTFVLAYDRAIRGVLEQDGTLDRAGLKASLTAEAKLLNIPGFLSQPAIDFLDAEGFFTVLAEEVKENGDLFGAYRAVGHGGLPGRVLRAFGLTAMTKAVGDQAATRELVRHVNEPGTAMIASSSPRLRQEVADRMSAGVEPAWWAASHAYTVLRYDAATDAVTLRNPWGRVPDPDGVFTLGVAEFAAVFLQVNYSK